ncbi:MAG TPA: hypothetical protein VLN58_02280 [Verrucomicrobiae bacterium]|nr:hypothetical protein [Verrucomicrobiae bacterium]
MAMGPDPESNSAWARGASDTDSESAATDANVASTNDVAPADASVEDAPTDSGKVEVKTAWPSGDFVVEDVPTVTRDGVELTREQADKVEKLAEQCGVRVVVGGK